MKTTDPKGLAKVNQILPIMQEHFKKLFKFIYN